MGGEGKRCHEADAGDHAGKPASHTTRSHVTGQKTPGLAPVVFSPLCRPKGARDRPTPPLSAWAVKSFSGFPPVVSRSHWHEPRSRCKTQLATPHVAHARRGPQGPRSSAGTLNKGPLNRPFVGWARLVSNQRPLAGFLPTATSGFGSTRPSQARGGCRSSRRGTSLAGSGRCGRRAPRAGSLRRRAARRQPRRPRADIADPRCW